MFTKIFTNNMIVNRFKILCVDKKEKYLFLFNGYRKGKFSIDHLKTINVLTNKDLGGIDLFFVVLYNDRDAFELLKLKNISTPIIIGSENTTILKKVKKLDCFSVVDMSPNVNLMVEFHDCVRQILR